MAPGNASMNVTWMLIGALVTLTISGVLTPLLAGWARRRNYLDVPNHRSSHVVATPRIGGVALVLGVLAGAIVLVVFGGAGSKSLLIVCAGAVAVALLGLADDFRHLPALVRLGVQTAIATTVMLAVTGFPPERGDAWLSQLVTMLWLVTLINAYNFMDGIDGIAGAQAVVAGAGWTAVGMIAGALDITALGLLLAAASLGFLWHNWHPAKVFMGDAGSGFFGFLFAALPLLEGDREGTSLWLCAVLLVWPFLADTGLTLLRRLSRGENILSAHRSHLYQRLVLGGRTHSYVALLYASLAILGAVAAVWVALATRSFV